jgi:hypothetical protein
VDRAAAVEAKNAPLCLNLNTSASLGTYQISRAGASYMRTPHLPGPWHYSFSSQFSAGHAKPSGRTAASDECASKNRQTGVWAC